MKELTKIYEVITNHVADSGTCGCIEGIAFVFFSTNEAAVEYATHQKNINVNEGWWYDVEEHIVFTDSGVEDENLKRVYEIHEFYLEPDGYSSETVKFVSTKEAAEKYIEHLEKVKLCSDTEYCLVDHEVHTNFNPPL
jgi:hypothetical protein